MDDDLAALARGEGWTEERHAAFLDRVELSFVRQLLAGTDVSRRLGHRPPPLDRPLPDSAVESNRSAARRRAANDADPAAAGC
ncbi:unnamed protein product [Urochloa decumbens]|uniref:Uncharacterized protein n=1 Tax=Urochloa decumbens TaxID=240449 RepID=A0ABC9EDR3_9POAL